MSVQVSYWNGKEKKTRQIELSLGFQQVTLNGVSSIFRRACIGSKPSWSSFIERPKIAVRRSREEFKARRAHREFLRSKAEEEAVLLQRAMKEVAEIKRIIPDAVIPSRSNLIKITKKIIKKEKVLAFQAKRQARLYENELARIAHERGNEIRKSFRDACNSNPLSRHFHNCKCSKCAPSSPQKFVQEIDDGQINLTWGVKDNGERYDEDEDTFIQAEKLFIAKSMGMSNTAGIRLTNTKIGYCPYCRTNNFMCECDPDMDEPEDDDEDYYEESDEEYTVDSGDEEMSARAHNREMHAGNGNTTSGPSSPRDKGEKKGDVSPKLGKKENPEIEKITETLKAFNLQLPQPPSSVAKPPPIERGESSKKPQPKLNKGDIMKTFEVQNDGDKYSPYWVFKDSDYNTVNQQRVEPGDVIRQEPQDKFLASLDDNIKSQFAEDVCIKTKCLDSVYMPKRISGACAACFSELCDLNEDALALRKKRTTITTNSHIWYFEELLEIKAKVQKRNQEFLLEELKRIKLDEKYSVETMLKNPRGIDFDNIQSHPFQKWGAYYSQVSRCEKAIVSGEKVFQVKMPETNAEAVLGNIELKWESYAAYENEAGQKVPAKGPQQKKKIEKIILCGCRAMDSLQQALLGGLEFDTIDIPRTDTEGLLDTKMQSTIPSHRTEILTAVRGERVRRFLKKEDPHTKNYLRKAGLKPDEKIWKWSTNFQLTCWIIKTVGDMLPSLSKGAVQRFESMWEKFLEHKNAEDKLISDAPELWGEFLETIRARHLHSDRQIAHIDSMPASIWRSNTGSKKKGKAAKVTFLDEEDKEEVEDESKYAAWFKLGWEKCDDPIEFCRLVAEEKINSSNVNRYVQSQHQLILGMLEAKKTYDMESPKDVNDSLLKKIKKNVKIIKFEKEGKLSEEEIDDKDAMLLAQRVQPLLKEKQAKATWDKLFNNNNGTAPYHTVKEWIAYYVKDGRPTEEKFIQSHNHLSISDSLEDVHLSHYRPGVWPELRAYARNYLSAKIAEIKWNERITKLKARLSDEQLEELRVSTRRRPGPNKDQAADRGGDQPNNAGESPRGKNSKGRRNKPTYNNPRGGTNDNRGQQQQQPPQQQQGPPQQPAPVGQQQYNAPRTGWREPCRYADRCNKYTAGIDCGFYHPRPQQQPGGYQRQNPQTRGFNQQQPGGYQQQQPQQPRQGWREPCNWGINCNHKETCQYWHPSGNPQQQGYGNNPTGGNNGYTPVGANGRPANPRGFQRKGPRAYPTNNNRGFRG